MEAGAPHTGMLRLANGQVKPLEVFLMADGWTANQDEAAACAVHMEEHNIRPLLPTGDGGYAVRDSCNRWPVNDNIRQRAQVRVCMPFRLTGLALGLYLLRVELGLHVAQRVRVCLPAPCTLTAGKQLLMTLCGTTHKAHLRPHEHSNTSPSWTRRGGLAVRQRTLAWAAGRRGPTARWAAGRRGPTVRWAAVAAGRWGPTALWAAAATPVASRRLAARHRLATCAPTTRSVPPVLVCSAVLRQSAIPRTCTHHFCTAPACPACACCSCKEQAVAGCSRVETQGGWAVRRGLGFAGPTAAAAYSERLAVSAHTWRGGQGRVLHAVGCVPPSGPGSGAWEPQATAAAPGWRQCGGSLEAAGQQGSGGNQQEPGHGWREWTAGPWRQGRRRNGLGAGIRGGAVKAWDGARGGAVGRCVRVGVPA